MSDKSKRLLDHNQFWQGIAALINGLPPEQREQYRQSLGAFMHDMKHTLGLIMNANELVRRGIKGCQGEHKAVEMIEIIKTGSQQLDDHLNIIVDDCCNLIEVEE